MCDVKYGCIADQEWPFKQTCQALGTDEENCITDYDCEINHYCFYPDSDLAD